MSARLRSPVAPTALAAALGLSAGIAACTGVIGAGDGAGGGPGSPGSSGSSIASPPYARLTDTQYNLTVADLFSPIKIPTQSLPADLTIGGFDNNAASQNPTAPLVEAYHNAAVFVAGAAMNDPTALLGCSPSTRADEDGCASAFFASFAKKAYRHPPDQDELTALGGFYTSQRAAGADFVTAMTLAIEAILQSPRFLYRVEIGAPLAGTSNVVALTPYEMASRLSYLLWNTMPDDALFAAAADGSLGTPEGIDAQARRMLADPRAHAAIVDFHRQWLRFDKMNGLTKDATMFPSFGPNTVASMQSSAEKFVEGVFFGDGMLNTLLTDHNAWVNDDLAPIYGVPSPGPNLTLVSVDAAQRSGILTNAGLMAGFAHQTSDSPVLRGVFVLDRIMCMPSPPPPPNVPPPPAPDAANPHTTRDRFAQLHEQGTCASCHHTIDGVGFGFEHYDAIGKWRTTDMGFPVDSSGWLSGSGDLQGNFDGAVELGQKLAASSQVQTCVASQWTRYALGVDSTGIDAATVAPIATAFASSGGNMRELVVAVTNSDAFRTRTFK